MTEKKEKDWLGDKIKTIKGYKSPSEQQKLLVLLAEMENRSEDDEKALSALIRAEKAAERAANARKEAVKLVNKKKEEERTARSRELYNSAGLMIVAGLVDTKTGKPLFDAGELVGALAALAQVSPDDERRRKWKQTGDAMLAERGTNKKD